uniref:Janus kinase and microtubule interacting protein 2 n=1 Tax=Sinocyclocheilus grahami TaxID=75366 RepID=A0A672RBG2_SINGR
MNLFLQVTKLEREKVQEGKRIREQEQHRHTAALTEQRARWHEEKLKELAALRESLTRQHEQELARTAKIKEGEIQRLRTALSALRDGSGEKVRTALTLEAREEARRFFDQERVKLLQDIAEIKSSKRQTDEALNTMILADKMKAGDLRTEHQAHQEQISKIKWDSERDIRRLVDEIKAKDRTIFSLEKELETATGFVQKLQLQKDALDEQLFLVKEAECNLGSPKREIPGRAGDGAEHCGSPDMRRNQKRMSELKATIRKLEDRNSILVDERNELLKRAREAEKQCKPLLDKNKLLSRKNDELSQSLQRMEDKLKSITKENLEMVGSSLFSDISPNVICILKCRFNNCSCYSPAQRHIVVDTLYGYDEESMDSETSSVASLRMDRTPATPDEDLDEGLAAEESELRFKQLTREYQALQRAYALLQEQKGGVLDAEMEAKISPGFTGYKAKVMSDAHGLLSSSQDSRWVEEKQLFLRRNQELLEKVEKLENENGKLQQELQDSKDQNELLEFRILELEERERRSPPFTLQIHPFSEGVSALQIYCIKEGVKDVCIPDLIKLLDILGDNGNLRNEEQVAIIQASTVLSLAEKWIQQIEGTEAALHQKMMDLELEMQIQELEATLYNALQQDKVIKYGEPLDELQKDELRAAVEKLRRQMLRKSREYDCQVLQERMELLHQAHQRIRDLEDKTDIQRRQIKDLEEKFLFLFLFFSLAFILWP